jgi:hypothetical protein
MVSAHPTAATHPRKIRASARSGTYVGGRAYTPSRSHAAKLRQASDHRPGGTSVPTPLSARRPWSEATAPGSVVDDAGSACTKNTVKPSSVSNGPKQTERPRGCVRWVVTWPDVPLVADNSSRERKPECAGAQRLGAPATAGGCGDSPSAHPRQRRIQPPARSGPLGLLFATFGYSPRSFFSLLTHGAVSRYYAQHKAWRAR